MRRTVIVMSAILGLLAAACGGNSGSSATTTFPSASTTSIGAPTTTVAPPTSNTVPATTTTLASTTTTAAAVTTSSPATPTTLAGEPVDFGPRAGDQLMVIGVRHDDVLNLRAGPGADQPILDGIPPTFSDLVAVGNTRQLPSSFWIEVDYEGTRGWVHMGYIGYEGDVTDETAHVIDELGERPFASTMTVLGEIVASAFASEEPESDIVQVTPVTGDDLSEVTYDVIGLGDDALRGLRLHIFAEESDAGFTLRNLEVTALCGRGVVDGLCA